MAVINHGLDVVCPSFNESYIYIPANKKDTTKLNVENMIEYNAYPCTVNDMSMPYDVIRFPYRMDSYNFFRLADKVCGSCEIIKVMSSWLTHPEKAKWECACNKNFW